MWVSGAILLYILLKNKARATEARRSTGVAASRDILVVVVASCCTRCHHGATRRRCGVLAEHMSRAQEHRRTGLEVTSTVRLWERLARQRRRLGETHTCLWCLDEGMASRILLV